MEGVTPGVEEEAEAKQGFRVAGPGSSTLGPLPGLLGARLHLQHHLIICMRKKYLSNLGEILKIR